MKTKSQPRYGGGRRLFPNRTPGTPRHRILIAEGSQETRVNPIPRRATGSNPIPECNPRKNPAYKGLHNPQRHGPKVLPTSEAEQRQMHQQTDLGPKRSHREHRGSSTALNYVADSHTQHRGRAPDHSRQVTQTEAVRRQLS